MAGKLVDRAPKRFLVQFGDFAAQGHRTVARAEVLKLGKQFGHAVGALVQHDGARRREQRRQSLLAAFFVGQESLEQKPVARQARGHQRRHKGGGAGQAFDVDAGFHAGADQQEPRVGNARRSGVGAQGQGHPTFQLLDHACQSTVLVVLVKRPKWGVDAKVPQEFSCGAGVFCQDGMGLLQHLQGAGRHVAQIAHRGGHHDEFAATHDTKVRTMRLANAS